MPRLQADGKNRYRIPRQDDMRVDVVVYLNEELYRSVGDDSAIEQLIHAASLPGVVGPVLGMPDLHSGFGLPIGGVMAMDAEEGLVSAGAVGMDINCGVRLLRSGIVASGMSRDHLRQVSAAIRARVPGGVGRKSKHSTRIRKELPRFLREGAPALVEMGFGRPEDLEHTEDGGRTEGADPASVSAKARARAEQLSTIGGGNHFIEIGRVDRILDGPAASLYGLEEGQLTILIHTGSRGFGHQICTDYSASMKNLANKYNFHLPSPGLAAAPITSPEGQRYLAAMAAAVNFAFCNRQWICDDVRRAFQAVLGKGAAEELHVVYDLAHNTARFETIDGQNLLIHRKGAIRALPGGHAECPAFYGTTGHPVLIPGSMGTASYVIKARHTVRSLFNSVNHGAGRVLSRRAAKRNLSVAQLKEKMKGILISGRNYRAYLDEAPQAYKDIEAVVETLEEAGFIDPVARLIPLAVIKGEGDD